MSPTLRRFITLLATASLSGFAACASPSPIKTERDPQANLSRYKTFAWATDIQSGSEQPDWTVLDETVKTSTEQQLSAKGLRKTSLSDADVWLTYSAPTVRRIKSGGGPGYWDGWGGAVRTSNTPPRESSLGLQFIDPHTRRTVWQGTAAEIMSTSGTNPNEIADAIQDLIQRYPPV